MSEAYPSYGRGGDSKSPTGPYPSTSEGEQCQGTAQPKKRPWKPVRISTQSVTLHVNRLKRSIRLHRTGRPWSVPHVLGFLTKRDARVVRKALRSEGLTGPTGSGAVAIR